MTLDKNPYTFKFSDGSSQFVTPEVAHKHADTNKLSITFDGYDKAKKQIYGRIKDGFTPGYQPHLGNRYVGGPREYAKVLKEMGLVETGTGYHKPQFSKEIDYRNDLDLAKELSRAGMSDREIDAYMDNLI